MKLKAWMDLKGLTPRTFGESMNPPRKKGTVQKWVEGSRTPRPAIQAEIKALTEGAVTGDDWLPAPKEDVPAAA